MHAYCPLVLLFNERNSRSVDPKNDHLRALDGAADRLVLLRADLLDPESLVEASLVENRPLIFDQNGL